MIEHTLNVICVAKQKGIYNKYVFKNKDNGEYIMCTLLPNWDIPEIKSKEEGFLKYQYVEAGERYYNRKRDAKIKFKFTDNYVISFLRNNSNFNEDEIII